MTAIISVIDWGYYFICYRNISINKPDSFFFFVVPTAIYIWSIIYIRHSYRALGVANGKIIYASSNASSETSTVLTDSSVFRFLIVRNDRLLLDVNEATMNNCSVDTPIIEIKAHELKGSLESGRADIERITGLSEFKIKLLFTSEDVPDNVTYYHFLVTLKPESESVNLQGHWLTLSAVNDLIKMGVVTSALANEIFRVYTMAMAWKTYDSKGYRRFPIRNYHPNFRLADLHDYDVDYNDKRWLRISTINQDAKWWFIRRFFL